MRHIPSVSVRLRKKILDQNSLDQKSYLIVKIFWECKLWKSIPNIVRWAHYNVKLLYSFFIPAWNLPIVMEKISELVGRIMNINTFLDLSEEELLMLPLSGFQHEKR